MTEEKCGCCSCTAEVAKLLAPMPGFVEHYNLPAVMCTDCFRTWRQDGLMDPDEISKAVWERRKKAGSM